MYSTFPRLISPLGSARLIMLSMAKHYPRRHIRVASRENVTEMGIVASRKNVTQRAIVASSRNVTIVGRESTAPVGPRDDV